MSINEMKGNENEYSGITIMMIVMTVVGAGILAVARLYKEVQAQEDDKFSRNNYVAESMETDNFGGASSSKVAYHHLS